MFNGIKISLSDAMYAAGAGALVGICAPVLTKLGNPVDGGLSIACFLRDMAGSLGLHRQIEFSYIRPELAGVLYGAFGASVVNGSFRPVESSAPVIRFIIGIIISFGVFVFIGCPLRVGLRIAGGDPSALWAAAGLISGVWIATLFLKNGFSLGESRKGNIAGAMMIHVVFILLIVLLFIKPAFVTLTTGRHAPLFISLAAGGVIGIAAQRSKLCFVSGFRNFFLIGDISLLCGFFFLVAAALITNIISGQAHFGTTIVGSSNALWSFTGLFCVGLGSTFIGGCPFRQLILAAQGNTGGTIAVFGMIAGAAISYNLYIAYIAESIETIGMITVAGSIVGLLLIGFTHIKRD